MKISIVLSTHAAQFAAVVFKGDFESSVAKIANMGYDGVELAIRDPKLVNSDELERICRSLATTRPCAPRLSNGSRVTCRWPHASMPSSSWA
jgi:sugar phosphate isomerase/epimerase